VGSAVESAEAVSCCRRKSSGQISILNHFSRAWRDFGYLAICRRHVGSDVSCLRYFFLPNPSPFLILHKA
jgi:hypothetical protein